MTGAQGMIAIMGSGETTDSMVRVHRWLLEKLPQPAKAVFIDTPAGFQMNADDLFDKSREYFQKRLNQRLERASFRSKHIPEYEAERAYQTLREADYIFVGPGSPTYALKNWAGTPIPGILVERVRRGGCFVAASAAALTLGRFTVPVYEIYKVGEDPYWAEGLNILGELGLPIAVIPHWNNAEGGTHDTRFCYLGEPRLMHLENLLPPETPILGVDEHTACILDFAAGQVFIRGVGGVTLRHGVHQQLLHDGDVLPLEEFRGMLLPRSLAHRPLPVQTTDAAAEPFVEQVKAIQESFGRNLQEGKTEAVIEGLISLDKMIWKSWREFQDEEQISQAREVLRGMIVQLALRLQEVPRDIPSLLSPLLGILLEVRGKLRQAKEWGLADLIRDKLEGAGITIEDTPQGPHWKLQEARTP